MSDGIGEGFLSRWSRRKHDQKSGRTSTPVPGQDVSSSAAAGQDADLFADFDFESLNFASDYRRFMAGSVPEQVQRQALRKLWTSTDIIAQTDELADFLEDFREEAMALPAELARSAYRVGRGFVEDQQDADQTDKRLSASEHLDTASETAAAPAIESGRDNGAPCKSISVDAEESGSETDKPPS